MSAAGSVWKQPVLLNGHALSPPPRQANGANGIPHEGHQIPIAVPRSGNLTASFCDLFCQTFGCAAQDFEERLFWLTLYPHSTLLARLIWRLNRTYFTHDLELIKEVKCLTRPDEVGLEVERYHYHRLASGFLRRWLKVRISGRRLLSIARGTFAGAA